MSALLWAAEPILIIGCAWLLLGERLTRPVLICAAFAVVGVIVLAGVDLAAGAGRRAAADGQSAALWLYGFWIYRNGV